MKIIEVSERSSVELPFSDLFSSGGSLKLRADIIGKGLVEIKQAQSALKLQVNGLIGRLPITDGLALDVHPKFPVSNLNRMIYASRSQLENPFFTHRPYETTRMRDYLPVPLIKAFSTALKKLSAQGLIREYKRQTVVGSPKPRINFNKSHQQYWSKLKPTHAVMDRFEFTHDILANQCLKLAAKKALAIAGSTDKLESCVAPLAASLRQFERVATLTQVAIMDALHTERASIPAERSDYASALECALELLRHNDVLLDNARRGLELESYVISLDNVFEEYIRGVISSFPDQGHGRIATVDGNIKRHQKHLFSDTKKYIIKPDLIMKDRRGVQMIGDVKYKIRPKEEDRYQLISHSLSYQVDKAILIYPKQPAQQESGLKRIGVIGPAQSPINVYEFFFNLNDDLQSEEARLRSEICNLLS